MTLATKIFNLSRRLALQVWIGGTFLQRSGPSSDIDMPGVSAITVRKSFASPVPVAQITVNRIPKWVLRGQRTSIRLGYDEEYAWVFNGYVQSREPDEQGQIVSAGKLYSLFRKTEITERDVDGQTVEQAIRGILDSSGIVAARYLSVPAFTLGQYSDAKLDRATLSQMLQTLMDIDGLKVTETGTGLVRIFAIDPAPASVAFRRYDTNNAPTARIIRGSSKEDPSALRTRVVVTGATVVEGTYPDDTSRTISGSASLENAALVSPPLGDGEYIEMEWSNHLIDSDAKAYDVAARLLTEYGRIPRLITLELPGDPELELGQTLDIDFEELGVVGFFVISGLEHRVDMSGYVTRVDLIGGEALGGTIEQPPRADFSYTIEHEVFGDRVQAFVTFDARNSHDPDGEIVSYAWSDNQTTTPEINTLSGPVATVRIDPTAVSGDWEVTLTVTGEDGLTGAVTITIDVPITSAIVQVPAIYAAKNHYMSATPDGAQTWNDQTRSTCISVAALPPDGVNYGFAVFGFSDGTIRRTDDFCASNPPQVKAPNSTAITALEWDWRNKRDVWALDINMNLWRSTDYGRSWNVYAVLRTVLSQSAATGRHIGLPGAGGVWVFGGTGGGSPLIAYDAVVGGQQWRTVQTVSGDLGNDLPGPAAVAVTDAIDRGDGTGLVILLRDAGSDVYGIYRTTNPTATNPDWTRPQGLPAALVAGRYIVPDMGFDPTVKFHAAFADRDVWHSPNGVNWSKTADVMPVGVTPNHAIAVGEVIHGLLYPNVHIIAAEDAGATEGIYKSSDGIQTIGLLRPATGFPAWPSSATAKQVAVGPSVGGDSRIFMTQVIDATVRVMASRIYNPSWAHTTIATALSSRDVLVPRCFTSLLWFVFGFIDATDYTSGICMRTEDGGATWGALSVPASGEVWQDIARAAGGVGGHPVRLWGLTINNSTPDQSKIWYSEDDGDSWTLSTTISASTNRLHHIVAHPTNPQRIAAIGVINATTLRTVITLNDGTGWDTNDDVGQIGASQGHHEEYLMLQTTQGTRIVGGGIQHFAIARDCVYSSDDNGSTWAVRWGPRSVDGFFLGPVKNQAGTVLFIVEHDDSNDVTRVFRSINSGITWAAMLPSVPRFAASDDPNGGIAYDERADALYVANKGGQDSNRWYILRMSPVDNLVPWVDFTDVAIPSAYSSFSHPDPAQALAVIP